MLFGILFAVIQTFYASPSWGNMKQILGDICKRIYVPYDEGLHEIKEMCNTMIRKLFQSRA